MPKRMLITAPEASPRMMARAGSVKISWRRLCANSRMRPTACVLDVRSWLLHITDGPRRQDTGKGKPRQETLELASCFARAHGCTFRYDRIEQRGVFTRSYPAGGRA